MDKQPLSRTGATNPLIAVISSQQYRHTLTQLSPFLVLLVSFWQLSTPFSPAFVCCTGLGCSVEAVAKLGISACFVHPGTWARWGVAWGRRTRACFASGVLVRCLVAHVVPRVLLFALGCLYSATDCSPGLHPCLVFCSLVRLPCQTLCS
jgi:hypothetical protein